MITIATLVLVVFTYCYVCELILKEYDLWQ